MTTPGKPITGGTALRLPAITSPNFNLQNPAASPSPSWAILINGLAYFFGLTITGGTITGPDYTINTSGAFFYMGAPAAGNLSVSVVPGTVQVTDAFGNKALAGLTYYLSQSGKSVAVNTGQPFGSGGTAVYLAATQAGPWAATSALISFAVDVAGTDVNVAIEGNAISIASGTSVSIPAGNFTSQAGTAANKTQVSTDIWQAVTPNAGNGWGGSGRVKFLAEANVVKCQMNLTAGTLTNGTAAASVPADYIPASTQFLPVGTANGTALTNGPYLQLTTGGNWQVENLPAGTTTVHLNGDYALD